MDLLGHDRLLDLVCPSAGSFLMCFTMSSSSLLLMLLLVLGVCDRAAGAKKQESVVPPEDHGSRLRGLWKLHMRDAMLKGKGERTHDLFIFLIH